MTDPIRPEQRDERPPLFGSWKAVYAFVLAFLALLILAMFLFGRAFS